MDEDQLEKLWNEEAPPGLQWNRLEPVMRAEIARIARIVRADLILSILRASD